MYVLTWSTLTLTVADLGLQVLDSVIMTRWKILPREHCTGMQDL
jgi:hypothetical protein